MYRDKYLKYKKISRFTKKDIYTNDLSSNSGGFYYSTSEGRLVDKYKKCINARNSDCLTPIKDLIDKDTTGAYLNKEYKNFTILSAAIWANNYSC